jgi:pilus assembly protein CpaB
LKRSNRLVLLVGVLLAVVAFGGVYVSLSSGPSPAAVDPNPDIKTVVAKVDIALGVRVEESMLAVQDKKADQRDATAYRDTGLVVGKVARKYITANQQITPALFEAAAGPLTELNVPAGKRAIAVQVDQVSGAGTLIRAGDYVDLLLALSASQFPVITLILQGMQVLGTLLPPTPAPAEGQPGGDPGTSLTGQQAILLLAVTPQQAEVIKFAQMDGSVSIVLRSPADFVDENNEPLVDVVADETTGIVLKSLVDEYGLLIPQLIQTIVPEALTPAN